MHAPVVLFTYKRPSHTLATLAGLAKNTCAAKTDLIVFSDGPKDESVREDVLAVRKIIRRISGFASVRVIEQPHNTGLADSIIRGVSQVISEYGRVITVEDDLLVTPHFLEYMNTALTYYESNPKVFSIGGYQHPRKTMPIPDGYTWHTYAFYRSCSWGWASWADRWEKVEWDMHYFDEFINDKKKQALFNRGGPDMTHLLQLQYQGKINSWAIRFCYAHFVHERYCIYPVKSLVNNIGLDQTGTHCKNPDSRKWHDELDSQWLPTQFCPADDVSPEIAANFYTAMSPVFTLSKIPRAVVRRMIALVRRFIHA